MEGSLCSESIICWLLVLSTRWSQAPTTAQRRVTSAQGRAGLQRQGEVGVKAPALGVGGGYDVSAATLSKKQEGRGLIYHRDVMPTLKGLFIWISFCTLSRTLKQNRTHILMLNFDFIPEKKCCFRHTDIRMLEKVSEDHLYQSQYSRSRTRGIILC